MAASLKGIDPDLKLYLKRHRLPDVYEALLSGLAIMCPDDPHQFIIDNLRHIQESGLGCLEWDMFIDPELRPEVKVITESNLDYIFNFDDNIQPTAEQYEMAYSHYNSTLKIKCYNAWMQYHLRKRYKRESLERKMALAAKHYRNRIYRIRLQMWTQWIEFRKGRQAIAFNKLQHIFHVALGRVIFTNWHKVTLKARETREYFERMRYLDSTKRQRLERGENMEDDDECGRGNGEARDDISILDKSLAVKIFSYVDICDLSRCACVCRSWKVITQASALWSKLDLTKVRHRLHDGVTDKVTMKLLQKCRPYLVHLNLRGCNLISMSSFQYVKECRNLQDLNLSECPAVTDDTMKMIANGCRILLYLNLSYTEITDSSLRAIAKNSSNLQYLSIAYCPNFTDKGLLYLANGKGARKLVYIEMSGCTQITSEGYKSLAKGCIFLHSLILNDISSLDDLCIQHISEKCKQMRTLSVLGSPNLSDDAFKMLAANKKLQKLKIDGNQLITDAALKMIGKFCPDLRFLYMTDCQKLTDMSLKSISTCKNLTVLNLADCVRITDVGVKHITESPCASKIQELNLTNCVRIGDFALVNIHKRCTRLAYLSVCYCEHISEAGIELLGQHKLTSLNITGCNCGDVGLSALGNNPRFKDVSLSGCVSITDLGLQKFAQQCPEIEILDISHCQLITDGAIKNLAFSCRMITSLNLSGCKLLTDLTVQYLSGVCHYLRRLDISGSLHITGKSMKYLRKGCKKLDALIMMYCKNISKHAANKMMRHVRQVVYNDDHPPIFFNY